MPIQTLSMLVGISMTAFMPSVTMVVCQGAREPSTDMFTSKMCVPKSAHRSRGVYIHTYWKLRPMSSRPTPTHDSRRIPAYSYVPFPSGSYASVTDSPRKLLVRHTSKMPATRHIYVCSVPGILYRSLLCYEIVDSVTIKVYITV